ncbi:MAG: arylamine N-acetyltransferase [Sandaracinaceae bacterium]|nr:arylamine N-acetyltransferase [Sandaracinaceae bacterium]
MTLLAPARVDAYLARLGVTDVETHLDGLAALQRAHLRSVPFHNLILLANDGRSRPLPPLLEVVDAAIEGLGGNCDRTTPAFAVLLSALGFDAALAAARVRAPGDHFVCVVELNGERHVVDVGNGHPYLRPWRLGGAPQEQEHHGWRFRFDPDAPGGPTLSRWRGDAGWKTVYVVDPTPRRYEDFTGIVEAHYTQPAFGPFLTGLRAARLDGDVVLTLRDAEYARDSRFGRSVRRVAGRDALGAVLVERFSLPSALIERALDVATRRTAAVISSAPRIVSSTSVGRADVPDVLVSCATRRARAEPFCRMVESLEAEVRRSGYRGHVGLLVIDLDAPAEPVPLPAPSIPVHRVAIAEVASRLRTSAATGVVPQLDRLRSVPIGVAREAQLAAIHGHLVAPVGGLPHPAQHPTVFWMVDDDVRFAQLDDAGEVRNRTDLFFRVAHLWSSLPRCSVVLGGFTGDPPVPALDCLRGQLRDLTASVERMLALGPAAVWSPDRSAPESWDAYYDLSETPSPSRAAPRLYPSPAGASVHDTAERLLRDVPRLLEGKEITRPLGWDGTDREPHASLRRGGNTVFLDLDALFRWPTPVVACSDGVVTRRADTLWAALAQREDPRAIAEVTLPLHHDRTGQRLSVADARAETAAQVRGVAMARALSGAEPVGTRLREREARVREHRVEARHDVARLAESIERLSKAPDFDVAEVASEALAALAALDEILELSTPVPTDAAELQRFLELLPAAVAHWRASW